MHTRRPRLRGTSPAMEPAVLSAVQQIQMRTGPRSPTWLNAEEFRIALLSATTVSSPASSILRLDFGTDSFIGKKLKRRLEDLERRAGSSSASPPQMHAELHQHDRKQNMKQQYQRSPEIVHRQPSPRMMSSQYTPPMEDNLMFPTHGFERDGSRTPPLFAYHTYPAPEEIVYPPYPQSQPHYHAVTAAEYRDYLAPVPVTLPSMMHFNEAIKREDDTMHPFNMYNPGLPAIDIHGQHAYDDSNPHVSICRAPYYKNLI